jgi:pimeloyl-ACP methyl ester carboxylesterase
VATTVADGITTRYEVRGDGPPLLMFSPGGFNATLENWSSIGVYTRLGLLERLKQQFTCITFDRRESGGSGGRLERITWASYVRQAVGLLDQLGVERAHLMGGCVGCSTVAALAVAHPERVSSMVLYSPAGGVKYRMGQHRRFIRHLAFLDEYGLDAVVELALSHEESFSKDPRGGPWVSVIRSDEAFAEAYRSQDPERYRIMVSGMMRSLFDRDTVPGIEPEDLLTLDTPALIVPGEDTSHAPSAARFLQECLPNTEYWDMPVDGQTAETAPPRVAEFLASVD